MDPALSVLRPQRIATEAFTDAAAAVVRLDEIYERNTHFLRNCFEAYVNGKSLTTRVRATYPVVRLTTSTHARLNPRAMMAPFIAPIEVSITQSGSMPLSWSAW